MSRNRRLFEQFVNEDFDEYLEKIKDPKEWAGEVEMNALALKYKLDFVIYSDVSKNPLTIKTPSSKKTIVLACTGTNRYDCVYSKSELSALAFCQAVVYEVLYKRVFDLGADVDVAVEKMLHDKAYSKQRRNNLLCHLFRESCRIDGVSDSHNLPEDDQASLKNPRLEIRKALAQGIPPFPYKVAKTLDPGIYRNVEFDMWNEKRKDDQKTEQFIVPKLEPGVKCKVYIEKEVYIGHIQDVYNDTDEVSVYIEELCKRCKVSTSVLEIVPVPAYKALTWQGGKTYKVYSENTPAGQIDTDKGKNKRGSKKNYQEYSPVHDGNNSSSKSNTIVRSNSLPTSQHNFYSKNNNSTQSRRRGPSSSTPVSNKSKNHYEKESRNQTIRSPGNFSCIWPADKNLPTSPIPIPGKLRTDCYRIHPESPETLNELNERNWVDESLKNSPPAFVNHPYTFAPVYTDDTGYSSMAANSFSNGMVSNATSVPLPIPGTQTTSPPLSEDAPSSPIQPAPCQTAMTVYPYPVYAVPGMYLVCRDGSTLPVNVGHWGSQEAVPGNEVAAGVPSVYFNTPPTGMSPPLTSWIPNYGSNWAQAMPTTTVAFTPPLDINAYQSLMSPPWSPQSGIYMPPPPPTVAYTVPPTQPPRFLQQEPAQN
ncbi:putative bifunctional UDP-N-acetylglucosamine transferase and deubiquitinase ALG13 [Uloborus diversus]|uniref:putative bifunctional UDP-N-acetylglucosamine transferase and deubiquitinase ALG13 n=1 Tax=Uloborus diversus TaxID=327109 RepID=UPI0024092408|nr:putative bifunctional UDP-N-acetylglucosamine transferase and deubiquitinase ALG13 [Uloborus diversus]